LTGIDTNVLVRYLVRDEPRQTAAATRFVEAECTPESPGFVSLVVLCELVWVLGRGYRYEQRRIAEVLAGLLAAADLEIESAEIAWQALNRFEHGKGDFADAVIGLVGRAQKAESTVTFDRTTAESDLFRLLPLES
jgi:predicted nucleic-acid-binding protein